MENKLLGYLTEAGCKKIRVSGEHAHCCCPFHKDRHPSFCMNLRNGLYICFNEDCGASGNLVRFLINALNYEERTAKEEAQLLLLDIDIPVEDIIKKMPPYEDRLRKSEVGGESREWTERSVKVFDFCPEYLLKRGFTEATLKDWEVGYDFSARRATFTVRDHLGHVVGVSKRATLNDQHPKYLHLHFRKSRVLYGIFRATGPDLGVTEGQLDAIAAWQMGLVHAVSTMGSKVGAEQIRLLRKYGARRLILYRDMDLAGHKWASYIGEALLPFYPYGKILVAVSYAGAKDLAEYMTTTDQDTTEITLMSFEQWRLGVY